MFAEIFLAAVKPFPWTDPYIIGHVLLLHSLNFSLLSLFAGKFFLKSFASWHRFITEAYFDLQVKLPPLFRADFQPNDKDGKYF